MLSNARVATRLPAQDLDRARRFYAEKLGLEAADERPGGLLYHSASGDFALYGSTGADVEGNYPSKGAKGERAAWFHDSEGNLLGVGQPVP